MTTQRSDYADADVRWSCARKKAYSDERIARRVALRLSEESGTSVVHYGCRHCGAYHVGRAHA